jgi:hypothetical protein
VTPVDTWISCIHPPRDDFAATMTDAEDEARTREGLADGAEAGV